MGTGQLLDPAWRSWRQLLWTSRVAGCMRGKPARRVDLAAGRPCICDRQRCGMSYRCTHKSWKILEKREQDAALSLARPRLSGRPIVGWRGLELCRCCSSLRAANTESILERGLASTPGCSEPVHLHLSSNNPANVPTGHVSHVLML